MTSHVHMIIGSHKDKMEDIVRDMKSYTSTQLHKTIKNHPQESRKDWLLSMMERAGQQNKNNNSWQFWQQHNQPIELDTNKMMDQKLEYIHQNPVEAGFVSEPKNWIYSSALDYSGQKGLIDISFIQ